MIFKVKKKLRPFLPVIVLIAVILAGYMYLKAKNGVTKVTAGKAEVRTIAKTISASGETAVLDNFIKRALISGSIKDLKFKSGDVVKKDDIILEMDQASLKASRDTAYSSYLGAKSDNDSYDQKVAAAKATESVRKRERDEAWRTYMADNGEDNKQAYKNAEALYQTAVSSLETLENDRQATKNAVYSTYSTYYSAFNNYTNSTVKAPADGPLALAGIYQGSYVTVGQELFSIVDKKNMIFKAEIDEADISHLKVGMKTTVNLDSYPGQVFAGEVKNIDAKVELLANGSTAVYADVSFTSDSILPIAGLNGSADIEFDKSDSIVSISPDSVFEDAGKKYVFVVVTDTLVKKEVEIGFEGDDYVGVIKGVNEGDLIVNNFAELKLKNGQRVSVTASTQ